MRRVKIKLFLAILGLGLILRIYGLEQIPNSLSADEASFAYNAYSILKTGRDEFGHRFPLYFQSFDDYKNPVFGYFLIPFIYFGGLNTWSIRFASVLAGTMVIPLFFLLTRKLTANPRLALLNALLAAISPWLIQYSRVAIDMELALFFSLLAVWVFLAAAKHKFLYLLSALVFGLSFYTYHSSRVWVIGFGLVLLILNRKFNRYIFGGLIILGLMTFPYFLSLRNSQVALRPYAVSVFANREEVNRDARDLQSEVKQKIPGAKLVHNRRLTFINQTVNGYLKILNPDLLFGQNLYNQIGSTRLFYLWQLPMILLGIIVLLKNRYQSWFILSWILIGYLPGGLTLLPVFDRRIFLNSFPLLLLASLGTVQLVKYFKLRFLRLQKIAAVAIAISIGLSFHFYLHNYFIHGRDTIVELWGNGMKQMVLTAKNLRPKYDEVFVSLKLNQTLTFFLFYEPYPPEKYLAEGGTVSGGYLDERNHFANYRFKFIQTKDLKPDTLYIWSADELQPCLGVLQTTTLTDGTPFAHFGIFDPTLAGCQTSTLSFAYTP